MSSLGIFFGPHIISLVETKANKILNIVQINRSSLVASGTEEKVPEDLKLVAVFKDELRRNRIEPTDATLALSGNDLIVRSFEMPLLPPEELRSAVNFEVKKYIPFKIEDLVADYQVEYDKASRRNIVLFAGIKKEILNKYLSILNQINVKVNTIEYSAFSALRFVKLAGLGQRGVVAVLNVDIQEDDEVNFIVLADGFPLFSRDITLSVAPDETLQTEALTPQQLLEKLKSELRLSVDFYNRKYPNRRLEKIIFLANDDLRPELDSFIKELGLPAAVFINSSKVLGRAGAYSLSIIKGFSASVSKIARSRVKLNLISGRASSPAKPGLLGPELASLMTGIQFDFRLIFLAILLCGGAYGYGQYLIHPIRQEVGRIKSQRAVVTTANPESSYAELADINMQYAEKIRALDEIVLKQPYVTIPMNSVAKLIPDGVWLTSFDFTQSEKPELRLLGSVALGDTTKEFEAVNKFITQLKNDPEFSRLFKQISLISIQQSGDTAYKKSDFSISCKQGK